ncbi:TSA family protein, partial [Colletotrichum tofieldiae]
LVTIKPHSNSSPPSPPVNFSVVMASAAVRFVAGTKKSPLGTLYLQCHVKPGASRVREGVMAVTEGSVELCVAAQAREGEANKAVLKLLSEVLGLPKSDLAITQGLKSRDKTVAVSNFKDPSGLILRVIDQLERAAKTE